MKLSSISTLSKVKIDARFIGLVGAVCIIFGVPLFGIVTGHSANWLDGAARVEQFLESISKSGVDGLIIVIALMVLIASTGFLPASLIGVASGTIYGVFGGFLISAFATLLGAWVSFAVSRSFFRSIFERLFIRRGRIRNLGDEVVKHGWRFVCLLRMSPIMPFSITSYAFGLSPIGTRDYMLGTIASLPALFGYVCIGWFARNSIGEKTSGVNYLQWAILGIGIVATVFLTVYIKRIMSAAIRRNDHA